MLFRVKLFSVSVFPIWNLHVCSLTLDYFAAAAASLSASYLCICICALSVAVSIVRANAVDVVMGCGHFKKCNVEKPRIASSLQWTAATGAEYQKTIANGAH